MAEAAAAMTALSPMSTLARGYAVPLDGKGRLLRSAEDFSPALDFDLRVVDGSVPCMVTGSPLVSRVDTGPQRDGGRSAVPAGRPGDANHAD